MPFYRFRSIRAKLVSLILGVAIVSILLVTLSNYTMTRESLTVQVGQRFDRLAFDTADKVDRNLQERYSDIQQLAESPTLRYSDSSSRDKQAYIQRVQRASGSYKNILITDAAGNVLTSTDSRIRSNQANTDWFRAARAGQIFVSQVRPSDQDPAELALYFSAPIYRLTGGFAGVVRSHWNLNILYNITDSVRIGKTGHVWVVDRTGTVIDDTPSERGQTLMSNQRSLPVVRAVLSGRHGYLTGSTEAGRQAIFGFAPNRGYEDFKGIGWGTIVEQDADEAFAPVQQLLWSNLVIALGLAVIVGGAGFLVGSTISSPLRMAARELAKHKDSLTLHLPITTTDEIGTLFQAFNASIVSQREATTALAQSAQQVTAILESIADAFCAFNQQWEFIYVNSRAVQMLGKPQADLLGACFWDVFPNLTGSVYDRELHRAVAEHIPVTFEARTSPTVWIEVRAFPYVGGLVVYTQDITPRKQAEQAKQEQSKAKGRFLSLVSHELRNPLTGVVGYSELLNDRLEKLEQDLAGESANGKLSRRVAKLRDFTSRIQHSGQLMTQQVHDLLDLGNLESGLFSVKPAPCDLLYLVRSVIEEQQGTTTRNHITLQGPSCLSIQADESRLYQAVTTLLAHALRFSPHGGTIGVTLFIQPDTSAIAPVLPPGIYLVISYEGSQIPAEALPTLFEYSGEMAHSGHEEHISLGVGLYLCKEIITLHGGSIRVERQEGEDSVFFLHLPLSIWNRENCIEQDTSKA